MSAEFISNLFRHGNVLKRRRKGRTLRVSARHRFGRWDRGPAFGPAFIVTVRPCCGRIRSCARVALSGVEALRLRGSTACGCPVTVWAAGAELLHLPAAGIAWATVRGSIRGAEVSEPRWLAELAERLQLHRLVIRRLCFHTSLAVVKTRFVAERSDDVLQSVIPSKNIHSKR